MGRAPLGCSSLGKLVDGSTDSVDIPEARNVLWQGRERQGKRPGARKGGKGTRLMGQVK